MDASSSSPSENNNTSKVHVSSSSTPNNDKNENESSSSNKTSQQQQQQQPHPHSLKKEGFDSHRSNRRKSRTGGYGATGGNGLGEGESIQKKVCLSFHMIGDGGEVVELISLN